MLDLAWGFTHTSRLVSTLLRQEERVKVPQEMILKSLFDRLKRYCNFT